MQFRQGKKTKYIPYELNDKVIDWKGMWFYIRNLSSSLPLLTLGPPVKRPSWNSRGGKADQVNFLLRKIEGLKADHQITGASVVAHCMPLQWRVHLAFEYTSEEDPTRYTLEKISEGELEGRVAALLKNIDWRPSFSGAFRADKCPQEYCFE